MTLLRKELHQPNVMMLTPFQNREEGAMLVRAVRNPEPGGATPSLTTKARLGPRLCLLNGPANDAVAEFARIQGRPCPPLNSGEFSYLLDSPDRAWQLWLAT